MQKKHTNRVANGKRENGVIRHCFCLYNLCIYFFFHFRLLNTLVSNSSDKINYTGQQTNFDSIYRNICTSKILKEFSTFWKGLSISNVEIFTVWKKILQKIRNFCFLVKTFTERNTSLNYIFLLRNKFLCVKFPVDYKSTVEKLRKNYVRKCQRFDVHVKFEFWISRFFCFFLCSVLEFSFWYCITNSNFANIWDKNVYLR